ncbi:hypothetical protein HMPREF1248_0792 [Coriobacteriaceae bacterium BV3Ac1]|nr:hypothetical protein HMPREF1248_0792 [Coriobacteriaceae bacterium BV3Ac1]
MVLKRLPLSCSVGAVFRLELLLQSIDNPHIFSVNGSHVVATWSV